MVLRRFFLQTFLPYSDFKKSAECLDKKRCWKQVVEAKQLLEVLKLSREGHTLSSAQKRIRNHPACRMWVGYENALECYHNCFFDISIDKWKIKPVKSFRLEEKISCKIPNWLGYEKLHANHRARLLDKNFEFYSQYNWIEKPILENYWPIDKDGKLQYDLVMWLEEAWYKKNNCHHAHCPKGCEHPQPMLTSDDRMLCKRCFFKNNEITEVEPCRPEIC